MKRYYINNNWKYQKGYLESYLNEYHEEFTDIRIPHSVTITPFNYFDESIYQMVSTYQRKTFLYLKAMKGNVCESSLKLLPMMPRSILMENFCLDMKEAIQHLALIFLKILDMGKIILSVSSLIAERILISRHLAKSLTI